MTLVGRVKDQSLHVVNIPMVILDGYPCGLKMISGVIPVSENGMSATGYIILSNKKSKVIINYFSSTIFEFALSTVFNLECDIAPLAPFKRNWCKFDVYWGQNGALRIL